MSDRDRDRRDYADDDMDDMDDMDGGSHGRGRKRRMGRRRDDYFVSSKTVPNYKEVDVLRRFLTERAKIRPRRQTGLNSKNQRRLAQQIKRARHLALLPFTDEHLRS